MGGACDTYRGDDSYIQRFGGKTSRKVIHLEGLGVDGSIILKRIWTSGRLL